MSAPDVAGGPGAGWDEAQCASALAQLEQLQAQVQTKSTLLNIIADTHKIDDLRLAIPRIIEPFQRPPSAGMFNQYAQGVQGCQNDIKSLHGQWRSPEIQAMFEHTRKSLAANTDLSASSAMPAHGWTEREKKERESQKNNCSESTDDGSTALTDDDVARIVTDFQKSNPSMKLEMSDDGRTMTVRSSFSFLRSLADLSADSSRL
jgi:hypothetical protein